jgi:16S rRNA (cytosine1402-N4)-methyltransferase
LKKSGRGFSFMRDEPLDMRYNPNWKLTAADIVNFWPPKAIEKILKEYGEERFAKSIVKEIIKQRKESPIKTTFELVEATKKGVPGWYKHRRIPRKNSFRILRGRHSATKTFQALRIAVNNELDNLKNVLPQALDILAPQGRIVIISFHSLEDRLVKNFFKEKQEKLKTLTKKPIRPSKEEIKLNPSSRSAKLRAAQKN